MVDVKWKEYIKEVETDPWCTRNNFESFRKENSWKYKNSRQLRVNKNKNKLIRPIAPISTIVSHSSEQKQFPGKGKRKTRVYTVTKQEVYLLLNYPLLFHQTEWQKSSVFYMFAVGVAEVPGPITGRHEKVFK